MDGLQPIDRCEELAGWRSPYKAANNAKQERVALASENGKGSGHHTDSGEGRAQE
jgi:hypothetical protein